MNNEVEHIKPYEGDGSKREQVEKMFDAIAPAYDFMNRAMTLGIDRWWRRVAVKRVKRHVAQGESHLLDVATGTGDFAIQLHQALQPCQVTGIDLSMGMMDVARRKVQQRGLENDIDFMQADCLALPFQDATFDAVTVAFGVRNFEHIDQGYSEMLRVLRPGGFLCVVELSTPTNRLVRWFYDLYTLHIIPAIGSLKSGDRNAYRYLPLSIAAVPQGQRMLDIMQAAGFTQCDVRCLTLGTCSIYTASKPLH
ncbi:MAG: bifunctional demethylmenaquinone methyltransferase/2-methoxy-6-polyprenyl-1,4-benzoquinol methylase UbiE [Muribaculaceae bacterium]|nr:bifunctional demethylmenaquinone methyltransferase/2-methoxy-6-polyprenyl-1,4-benzoquinol methylase UbiE [Muribaculaceae bacterium]